MNAFPALDATIRSFPRTGAAEDEGDPMRYFYPTHRFLQALDPSYLLVLGDRGVGKSALFGVLASGGVRSLLEVPQRKSDVPELLTVDSEAWPPRAVLDSQLGADRVEHEAFWAGLLVRHLAARHPSEIWPVEVVGPDTMDEWLPATRRNLERVFLALGAFDADLQARGVKLLVVYDELDKLSLSYSGLFAPIRGLLGFWYSQARALRMIRPKIFLRTDLFRPRTLDFPDATKMFRGHAIELAWDRDSLYAMWLKRIRNVAHDRLRGDVSAWMAHVVPRLDWVPMGDRLGELPWQPDEALLRPAIEALVGPWMGPNPRKGATYNWLPNHIQDANGRLAPRSFLSLLRRAAELTLEDPGAATSAHPMRPTHLQTALEAASEDRIRELGEEDPWLVQLPDLLRDLSVPTRRQDLSRRLKPDRWPASHKPPFASPDEIFDHLVERGIVEPRVDGRYNVPDIYLFGLGMKRKGGVKRAR